MPSALKAPGSRARLELARADAMRERAFRARILGAVKNRLAELRTRNLRLSNLQKHLEKESAEFALETSKELPSMWPFSLSGALKAWNQLEKFQEVWNTHNEEVEWQPADDRLIDKLSREVVDFRNEIAICDWLIAAYNKELAHLATDRAQEPGQQQAPPLSPEIAGPPHRAREMHGVESRVLPR
jgi:hypothetical protein